MVRLRFLFALRLVRVKRSELNCEGPTCFVLACTTGLGSSSRVETNSNKGGLCPYVLVVPATLGTVGVVTLVDST